MNIGILLNLYYFQRINVLQPVFWTWVLIDIIIHCETSAPFRYCDIVLWHQGVLHINLIYYALFIVFGFSPLDCADNRSLSDTIKVVLTTRAYNSRNSMITMSYFLYSCINGC